MRSFPEMVPITDREQLKGVVEAASEDNHVVLGATHLFRKDGKIVGYAGVAGCPTVTFWMKTGLVTARESVGALQMIETLIRERGRWGFLALVQASSPFHDRMKKLGFSPYGAEPFLRLLPE